MTDNNEKDSVNFQDNNTEEKFSDEPTDLKIHKHLSDVNDVISDEDIKNVRTDFPEASTEVSLQNHSTNEPGKEEDITDDKLTEEKKDLKEDKAEHPVITPWNILG